MRLLTEAVALAAGGLACLALLRWLWRVELTLPTGFLPEGSVFDAEHYRRWWAEAFPPGAVSVFGQQLAERLRRTHLLAAGEALALLFSAGLAPIKKLVYGDYHRYPATGHRRGTDLPVRAGGAVHRRGGVKMIQVVLSNPTHPEYGQTTISFPIPDEEYNHMMELLEPLEIGDVLKRDCRADKLHSAWPILVQS